jgi:hypothetical protein
MSDRLAEVQRRRAELVARAARERDEAGRLVDAVLAPMRAGHWLSAAWQFARSRPLLVVGTVAAVVVLRPSRAIAWGVRLWAGLQTLRRLKARFFTATAGGALGAGRRRKDRERAGDAGVL